MERVNNINDLAHTFETLTDDIEIIGSHGHILQEIKENMDRLSIKTALKELVAKDKDKRLKLFTKLSPGTLVTEDLLEWLLYKIEKAVIETNQVVLCIEADVAQSYLN